MGVGAGVSCVTEVFSGAVQVALARGEVVAAVLRQGSPQLVELGVVAGAGVAETFEAEGERVVGPHGLEGDAGPVVVKLPVDVGDAGDPPAVFSVPAGTRCDGSFQLVDLRVCHPLHRGGAVDAGLRGDECVVGTFDVASSAPAQPVQRPELVSLAARLCEALRGPLVLLGGVVGLSAGGVELCAVVGWSGGDDRGVLGALVAQGVVEDPGVVVCGERLGLSAAQAVGDDLRRGALIGQQGLGMVGVGTGVPGVGGLAAARLSDITGQLVEGRECRAGGRGPTCRLGRLRWCAPRRARCWVCRRACSRRPLRRRESCVHHRRGSRQRPPR